MVATADGQGFAYLQIAATLRAEIASGAVAPGERISSIRELADRFKVSAQTVQKALVELANEGTVTAGSTRGYYVSDGGAKPTAAVHDSLRLTILEEQFRVLAERVGRLEAGQER